MSWHHCIYIPEDKIRAMIIERLKVKVALKFITLQKKLNTFKWLTLQVAYRQFTLVINNASKRRLGKKICVWTGRTSYFAIWGQPCLNICMSSSFDSTAKFNTKTRLVWRLFLMFCKELRYAALLKHTNKRNPSWFTKVRNKSFFKIFQPQNNGHNPL